MNRSLLVLSKRTLSLGLGALFAFTALAGAQSTVSAKAPIVHTRASLGRGVQRNPGTPMLKSGTNLTFHGGPVITSAHVVYIFCGPTFNNILSSDYTYAQALQGFRNAFGTTPEYNTITQYSGSNGSIALTNLAAGTSDWFDTSTPPANVTDAFVLGEVNTYLSTHGFDASAIYQVILPSTSFFTRADGYTSCGGPPSNFKYCAYHGYYMSGSNAVKYALQGYPSCGNCQVSGWTDAQSMEHFIAHETREAVTDPQFNGWYGADTSEEADDKCNWSPTPFLGTGGYGYQYEWSNAVNDCVASTPLTPPTNYVGHLDHAGCDTLAGWAADWNRPNTSLNVSFYDGGSLFTTVLASLSRPDVAAYLGDNGLHGFSFATPASLRDGNTHVVSAMFESSSTNLGASPVSLTCRNRLDHASFTFPSGAAHSFYLDMNQHVIDLSLSSTGLWTKQDLTALTGAGAAAADSALAAMLDSAGNGRVFYVGTNRHVWQLKLDTTNTWTDAGDATSKAGSTKTVAPGSSLAAFGPAVSTSVHVLYLDSTQHVNDLRRTVPEPATWSNEDVTTLTSAGSALAGSTLAGLTDAAGNVRAFFVGTNQHVWQLKLSTANAWSNSGDVMVSAGITKTVAAGSSLVAIGPAVGSSVHVLFLDSTQHVNDLARTIPEPATWSNRDATSLAGVGAATSGSSLAGLVDAVGNVRAFYVGTNQHAWQLKLDTTNTWTDSGDTMVKAGITKTVMPGSSLTSFGPAGGSSVHLLYLDSIQQVNDLARTVPEPASWTNQDLTP